MTASRSGVITAYTGTLSPVLEGGDSAYVDREFAKIAATLKSIQALCPQAAFKAPANPVDGAVRLSRAPWRPLEGQNTDKWVYYDASLSAWAAFP